MSTEKTNQTPDFFTSLYDVNNHEVPAPRLIGGGKITRKQAAALDIVPTGTPTDEQ